MNVPEFTVRALAEACGGRMVDPAAGDRIIRHVATMADAGDDGVTWVTNDVHARGLDQTSAGAIIGLAAHVGGSPRGIVVEDPESALVDILDQFSVPPSSPPLGVHPTAVVASEATLGEGVRVGAGAVVKSGARIGRDTILHDGVSIGAGVRVGAGCVLYPCCVVYDRCEIGDRVTIHACSVIGADGFNYILRDGRHRKVPQIGTVVVEDDVEIGANTCIDRAKVGVTRIGRGTKIDNLVQVAHNVKIGPLCMVVAQVGLAGSSELGTGVFLAGRAGASHGVEIGDGARVAATSVAFSKVAAGATVSGTPARDHRRELRSQARVRQLPELFEKIATLTKRVAELEAAADDS